MFGIYNGFVSKARVPACMYFLVALVIRGNVHIHVATQNIKMTFWLGEWVKTLTL
jgi:hypothetical protein